MKKTNLKIATIVLILATLIFTASCANQNIRFTNRLSSLTQSDNSYLKNNYEMVQRDAEITLNRHFFLYIPVNGWYNFTDEKATDELLLKYNADLVTDLKIDRKLLILLYYNRYYVVASGNIWRRKSAS